MAITTDFIGHIGIEPALDSDQIERLAALGAAARDQGEPRFQCGWLACDGGCCLTHSGDEKYGDPAGWLRYLVRSSLKPRDLRADGMVVGCRRDTKELFCIHVTANRVSERDLWPRSAQPREAPRRAAPPPRPAAQVIDLAARRARA